jgi:hypothetical protein
MSSIFSIFSLTTPYILHSHPHFTSLPVLTQPKKPSKTSSPTLPSLRSRRRRSISRCRTQHVLRIRARGVVHHLPATQTSLGADIVVRLGRLVRVLRYSLRVRRVDDHDHALLAVLRLRAVDVHGVGVCDGHHEHGGVAGLAVVVAAVSAAVTRRAVGVAGDGLEVGEDCVALGLAGGVCVGGGYAVVLRCVSLVLSKGYGGHVPARRS